MNYQLEELVPLVAALADKYTMNESTSISYTKANQLMEAVLYCIDVGEHSGLPIGKQKLSAQEAYKYGYECVFNKVKESQKRYNEMLLTFHAYGNENYKLTVEQAIPGFFHYYDIRYAPQETGITMDYPILTSLYGECGIQAISKYVDAICLEQKFLNALPEAYVRQILYQFDSDYASQYYNICNIVFRNLMCHIMLGKSLEETSTKEDYEKLRKIVLFFGNDSSVRKKRSLNENLQQCLTVLVDNAYKGDVALEQYLRNDLKNFATELRLTAKYNSMENAFVI
ncbi:MAG: hypothetical protein E7299_02370 [Lachnospiraceae bacterium]|nr:hypothetical protein [Lachnospiraceae bacterium]